MGSLDTLREEFKQFLLTWLESNVPGASVFLFDVFVLVWIAFFGLIVHLILHVFLRRILVRLSDKKGDRWTKALLDNNLFHRLAYVLQGAIVHLQTDLWLEKTSFLLHLLEGLADQWILLFALLSLFSVLDAFESLVYGRSNRIRFPFRGLIQTIKLVASLLIGLLAVSVLMGKSPLILFSGLGALSAVLLLVFKDAILGLVAGIQLSANQMLSVGDWLEMPKYGADGDVIDIALTTVKVRNWDKTITTIPTYALISDSFKNWRGMSDAGARRIKRSVLIDTSSIRFLDEALLQHLRKAALLDKYLDEMTQTVRRDNEKKNLDMSVRINGRRLTNIGTFRAYLVSYLKVHPDIHKGMTLLIRQRDPTRDGLPIEIYTFTNTTNWNRYEDIQSDIFDHIFAVLPEFELRAHEAPTGHDLRTFAEKSETSMT